MNNEEKNPRRDFVKKSLAGTIALGAGMTFGTSLLSTLSADASPLTGNDQQPVAHDEKAFRMGVIGPAELSLATSQIAVNKTTNKNAKEFAGFELGEAIAVTGVLKDLGTPVPPMTAKAKATLEKIKSTPAGAEFDKIYIEAQKENHEFLRDLAQNYINAGKLPGAAENQGRHLATLSLAVFKEHVAITTRILTELGG
jgi:putative membrane protein